MNAARRELAAGIHAAASEHDAALEDRLARYRILEPETAELRVADAADTRLQLAVKR